VLVAGQAWRPQAQPPLESEQAQPPLESEQALPPLESKQALPPLESEQALPPLESKQVLPLGVGRRRPLGPGHVLCRPRRARPAATASVLRR
jgi:hypothetical protein